MKRLTQLLMVLATAVLLTACGVSDKKSFTQLQTVVVETIEKEKIRRAGMIARAAGTRRTLRANANAATMAVAQADAGNAMMAPSTPQPSEIERAVNASRPSGSPIRPIRANSRWLRHPWVAARAASANDAAGSANAIHRIPLSRAGLS